MKVLVACEESQRVCMAFRKRGHEAYSCDIIEPSGGHPEWHILGDVLPLLNGNCSFTTMGGQRVDVDGKWDLIIAHPPCTYLTVSGNRWFNEERYGESARVRKHLREDAVEFFLRFANADCDRIAIENPIGCMSTIYRKPDQIIQPYEYGHTVRKATCLWLKNLPKLEPTNIVEPIVINFKNGNGTMSLWFMETLKLPSDERARERSKTFEGIAKAMAEQYGGDIRDGEIDGITKWR